MLFKKLTIIILVLFLAFNATGISFAQSVDEIKQNIDSHNQKIKQLEEEIKAYEKQIDTVSGQAQTLQSAIKVLDINQKSSRPIKKNCPIKKWLLKEKRRSWFL